MTLLHSNVSLVTQHHFIQYFITLFVQLMLNFSNYSGFSKHFKKGTETKIDYNYSLKIIDDYI